MNPGDYVALFGAVFTVICTIIGSVWFIQGWLHKQFSSVRGLMFDKLDLMEGSILSKLEYHEKHDDQRFTDMAKRFEDVNKNLWTIRLRNATLDARLNKRDYSKDEDINTSE